MWGRKDLVRTRRPQKPPPPGAELWLIILFDLGLGSFLSHAWVLGFRTPTPPPEDGRLFVFGTLSILFWGLTGVLGIGAGLLLVPRKLRQLGSYVHRGFLWGLVLTSASAVLTAFLPSEGGLGSLLTLVAGGLLGFCALIALLCASYLRGTDLT
jgi:hypothetical protein